jgi:hypothetical protein
MTQPHEDDAQLAIWEELPPEAILSEARRNAAIIDDLALDEEFRRTPSDLAYWNERYSQALKTYLLAKQRKETTWARLWLEIREGESAGDPKHRVTVDDLKAMVQVRDEYQEVELETIEAEAAKESIKRFCDAISAKKDMLQSLGAKLRAEMDGDPAIRALHAESRRFSK